MYLLLVILHIDLHLFVAGAVLGALLMESFYVVFDRKNRQIGFAATKCPPPDPNSPYINGSVDGPYTDGGIVCFGVCAYKCMHVCVGVRTSAMEREVYIYMPMA